MVQSPSWEVNWFAASQEIHHISRNPKVHYRTHKRPPPVSILGQPNPVHIPTSHLLEIHPNIIQPSTPRSPQWSLSLRFPNQNPIGPLLLTHTRHMPSPSYSSRFYHPHNILWLTNWLFLRNSSVHHSHHKTHALIHWASSRYIALELIAISTLLLQGLLSDSFSWSFSAKSDLARTVCS